MRIIMMACTERGIDTMRRAAAGLGTALPGAEILTEGRCAFVQGYEEGPRLSELTRKWFHEADALVFFTATGIAVRCIAPFVRDKFRDPAVLTVDENGTYVISLLSGHAGGANRLCLQLAGTIGAQPVITTATDGRGLFAVDVFAAEKGLQISDRRLAKNISARLLSGETVFLFFDREQSGGEPEKPDPDAFGHGAEVTGERFRANVIISCRRMPEDRSDALFLIPRHVTLGIGCRRGAGSVQIRESVEQILQETGIFRQALCGIASIDLKKEEAGLLSFAEEWGLPVTFFTAAQLESARGEFSSSAFVRKITGVDNVCERSAVCLAGERGVLLAKRHKGDGVTCALALKADTGLSPGCHRDGSGDNIYSYG